jgi:hypothetical protein
MFLKKIIFTIFTTNKHVEAINEVKSDCNVISRLNCATDKIAFFGSKFNEEERDVTDMILNFE